MIQKIEIGQNYKRFVRAIASIVPPLAIVRIEEIRHKTIRIISGIVRFKDAGSLEFSQTLQFVA